MHSEMNNWHLVRLIQERLTLRFLTKQHLLMRLHSNLSPGTRVYNTAYGDEADNRGNAYFYRDSGTYNVVGNNYIAVIGGANVAVNPNTFQIFTYGNDGMAADATLDQTSSARGILNEDNITNFANGRLDAFDWQANLGNATTY